MTTVPWQRASRGLAVLAALTIVQLFAVPPASADYDVGAIHIAQPWARATPKGAGSGAGYLTVTNNGTTSDRLNCVSDDASGKCQIHA